MPILLHDFEAKLGVRAASFQKPIQRVRNAYRHSTRLLGGIPSSMARVDYSLKGGQTQEARCCFLARL
jgi:hypothetical protein